MSERLRSADLKGSWEWLAFAASLPADPVSFTSVAADVLLESGRMILTGISVQNTATTGGSLVVRDGQDVTGQNVLRIGMAASTTSNVQIPGNGILLELGAYLDVSGITVTGNLYVVHLARYNLTPPGE